MKDAEEQNEILIDILEQMVLVMKESRKEVESSRELIKDLMQHNALYCRFVEERFSVDETEIAADFDEWIEQFSEEELQQFAKDGMPDRDSMEPPSEKNDAEVPEALYTIDEIMSELEPPKEGHDD